MKTSAIILITLVYGLFQNTTTLKGKWQFIGGIYNDKKEGPPAGYSLLRKYDDAHYQAFAIEKGYKPEKYEAGGYKIAGDTCIDTETFSSQPSKIKNIPVHYLLTVRNDSLILKGVLPTGMRVEEYWKKVK